MALYIPESRRTRNAAALALLTLVLGVAGGFLAGRSSAVTAEERSADVHARADTLGTRLEALTIEYEQAIAGTGDTVQAGVLDALDLIDSDLDALLDDAPWIGPTQATALHRSVTAVRATAAATASVDAFTAVVDEAATTVRVTFGVA